MYKLRMWRKMKNVNRTKKYIGDEMKILVKMKLFTKRPQNDNYYRNYAW